MIDKKIIALCARKTTLPSPHDMCSFGGRVLTHTFPPPPLPSASELDSAVSARICSHHILEMLCSQHILEMLAAVTNVLLGIPTLEAARLDSLTKT